jgi:hypothetical protein
MTEATIIVNGQLLNVAQAITVRVALNDFIAGLSTEGLGVDAVGVQMAEAYKQRAREVLGMIMKGNAG